MPSTRGKVHVFLNPVQGYAWPKNPRQRTSETVPPETRRGSTGFAFICGNDKLPLARVCEPWVPLCKGYYPWPGFASLGYP